MHSSNCPFVSSWRHTPIERQNLITLTSLLLQEEREINKCIPNKHGKQNDLNALSSASFHDQNQQVALSGQKFPCNPNSYKGKKRSYQGKNPNHYKGLENGEHLICTYCGKRFMVC